MFNAIFAVICFRKEILLYTISSSFILPDNFSEIQTKMTFKNFSVGTFKNVLRKGFIDFLVTE